MPTATLSFTVRIAHTPEDLLAACEVRSASYGHHVPAWRTAFARPDALDLSPATAVFVCRDKQSSRPVGTARVQVNSLAPLLIENSVPVPEDMRDDARAEITRLAVAPGHTDPLIKLALMKACYLYCMANQVRWMVIGARSAALVRQYRRLGFTDLHPDGRPVALAHAGHVEHWVLAFDVRAAERHWHESKHPLYAFMVDTVHPDIRLFEPALAAAGLDRLEALAA
jgi:ribosomal protein S18 acetylase RimI-like enzyme